MHKVFDSIFTVGKKLYVLGQRTRNPPVYEPIVFMPKYNFAAVHSSADSPKPSMKQITTYRLLSLQVLFALFPADMPLDRFVPVEIIQYEPEPGPEIVPFMSAFGFISELWLSVFETDANMQGF